MSIDPFTLATSLVSGSSNSGAGKHDGTQAFKPGFSNGTNAMEGAFGIPSAAITPEVPISFSGASSTKLSLSAFITVVVAFVITI